MPKCILEQFELEDVAGTVEQELARQDKLMRQSRGDEEATRETQRAVEDLPVSDDQSEETETGPIL